MDTVTLGHGRHARAARRHPAGGVDRRGRHRRPGVPGDARRARPGRHPLGRQPDRPVAAPAEVDAGDGGARARRAPTTPTCPGTATRGYDVQQLRPRPRLPGGEQPAHRAGAAARRSPTGRSTGSASTSLGLRVTKVTRRRPPRPRRFAQRGGQAARHARRAGAGAARRFAARRPLRRRARARCAAVGRGRLGGARPTACSSPASPTARPSWFPCNDRPRDKATLPHRGHHRRRGYHVVANGALDSSARRGASRTTWVYEQAEPMATYLATVQIGRYDAVELAAAPVPPARRRCPPGCASAFAHDFGRQPEMMDVVRAAVRAVPVRATTRSSSPTTTSRSRSRRRGCRSSARNHLDGDAAPSGWSRTSWRTSGSATA